MGWTGAAARTLAIVGIVGACSHDNRAPVSPIGAPPSSPGALGPDRDSDDVADPADRCPWILDGCTDTSQDTDGCPDVSLEIADCRLSATDDSWLGEVVREIGAKPDMGAVRVVSGVVACANAVREALVKRGIAASKIETRTAPRRAADVSFEAAVWKGKECP